MTENLGVVEFHEETIRVGKFNLRPLDRLVNKETNAEGSFFGVQKFHDAASNLVVCDADKCFSLTKKEFLERYTVARK